MAKLYEIGQRYQNLLDLIENEEVPAELLEGALQEVEDEFGNKAENIIKFLRNIESDIEALKVEEKRFYSRRKALENKLDSLKGYLFSNLKKLDIKKATFGLFQVSIRGTQASLKAIDEDKVPEDFFKVKKEVDKTKLKDYLKTLSEEELELLGYAKLEKGETLSIK